MQSKAFISKALQGGSGLSAVKCRCKSASFTPHSLLVLGFGVSLGAFFFCLVFQAFSFNQPGFLCAVLLISFCSGAACVRLGNQISPRPSDAAADESHGHLLPMFVYTGNRPGSGKSLLSRLVKEKQAPSVPDVNFPSVLDGVDVRVVPASVLPESVKGVVFVPNKKPSVIKA